jgi:hypothetical protein
MIERALDLPSSNEDQSTQADKSEDDFSNYLVQVEMNNANDAGERDDEDGLDDN